MPIFDAGSPAYQGPTTVGTSASQRIWSGTNTALVNANPTAVTVRDLVVQNLGTAPIFVSTGTVNAASQNGGIYVPAGALMVVQGWTAVTGTTTNDIFAVAQSNLGASICAASVGTLISAV